MSSNDVKLHVGNGCKVEEGMGGNGEPCYALQVILESVNKLEEKLDKRFDEMARNREDTARDQGITREKLRALEDFHKTHLEDHKWIFRSIVTSLLAAAGALLVALRKG